MTISKINNCFNFQAIYKKISTLGLKSLIEENKDAAQSVKDVTCLALLPEIEVVPMFNKLVNDLDVELRHKLQKFIAYYENFWIKQVKPKYYSVFKLVTRTTNAIESLHEQLRNLMQANPNPYYFISK